MIKEMYCWEVVFNNETDERIKHFITEKETVNLVESEILNLNEWKHDAFFSRCFINRMTNLFSVNIEENEIKTDNIFHCWKVVFHNTIPKEYSVPNFTVRVVTTKNRLYAEVEKIANICLKEFFADAPLRVEKFFIYSLEYLFEVYLLEEIK